MSQTRRSHGNSHATFPWSQLTTHRTCTIYRGQHQIQRYSPIRFSRLCTRGIGEGNASDRGTVLTHPHTLTGVGVKTGTIHSFSTIHLLGFHFLEYKTRLLVPSRMRKQMTINQPTQLLTVKETALSLGVSTRTVTRLITSGDLESVTIGRCRRIRTTAITRFIDEKQKQHRQQVVGF